MKLTIEGIPPYDGDYSMDETFTNREMHRIKELCGLRGGEVFDALVSADMGGYVAVATVLLERGGVIVDPDMLWDAPSGKIRLDASSSNGSDARPPDVTNSEGSSPEPSESTESSGPPSGQPGD